MFFRASSERWCGVGRNTGIKRRLEVRNLRDGEDRQQNREDISSALFLAWTNTKMKFAVCIVAFVALLGAVSAQRCPRYDVQVVDGTARNARGLKSTVDRYIRLLGGRDNMNLPGPLRNGQRSVRVYMTSETLFLP